MFAADIGNHDTVRGATAALRAEKPVLLAGGPSSGKSRLIAHLAEQFKTATIHIHVLSIQDAKDLVGGYAATDVPGEFKYLHGPLAKAVSTGKWVIFEDVDKVSTDVLSLYADLFSSRTLAAPNGSLVQAAPSFRILATCRSDAALNASVQGRFVRFAMPPLDAHLRRLLECSLGALALPSGEAVSPASLIRLVVAVHDSARSTPGAQGTQGTQGAGVALRDIIRWSNRLLLSVRRGTLVLSESFVRHGLASALSEAAKQVIVREASDTILAGLGDAHAAGRAAFLAALAHHLGLSAEAVADDLCHGRRVCDVSTLSGELHCGRFTLRAPRELAPTPLRQQVALTSFTTRVMETIAGCIASGEPLLFVGATGVGKTTYLQAIARTLQRRMHVVNLSSQTEVFDLVGGFRPVSAERLVRRLYAAVVDAFPRVFSLEQNPRFVQELRRALQEGSHGRLLKLAASFVATARRTGPGAGAGVGPGDAPDDGAGCAETAAAVDEIDAFAHQLRKHLDAARADGAAGARARFAFAFAEGPLYQALARGDWLLLDEINLASSEVLEVVAAALGRGGGGGGDDDAFVVPERGAVRRHPHFRCFAAMNPATDHGRRELPAALRARFTQVFVGEMADAHDLAALARFHLGMEADQTSDVPLRIAGLYTRLQRLAATALRTASTGAAPTFSLRNLSRALRFASLYRAALSLRRALYEGFALTFTTSLARESVRVVDPLLRDEFLGDDRACLGQPFVVSADADPARLYRHAACAPVEVVDGIFLPPGPAYRAGGAAGAADARDPCASTHVLTASARAYLRSIAKAVAAGIPVLLEGSTSSGKTSLIAHMARVLGYPVVRINNHEHTDLAEYLGSYAPDAETGRLVFCDGALVRALRSGAWVILDELNMASSDVLEALNRLLDDNRQVLVPETQECVAPAPGFHLFATQNPAQTYAGRKQLSEAFRNRFVTVEFEDISLAELKEILLGRAASSALAPRHCELLIVTVQRIRFALAHASDGAPGDGAGAGGGGADLSNGQVTLRDLFRIADRLPGSLSALALCIFELLGERQRSAARREAVRLAICECLRLRPDAFTPAHIEQAYAARVRPVVAALRLSAALGDARGAALHAFRCIVWTPSMVRLFALLLGSAAHGEAPLLVGASGAGKTTAVALLAHVLARPLVQMNLHKNTEAADLVGGLRPLQGRRLLADRRAFLASLLEAAEAADTAADADTAAATSTGTAADTDRALIARELAELDRAAATRLFEWQDGPLLQAMKRGSLLLLDEVSLADDAVLERLNSVLEAGRTLTIAEDASAAATACVAAHPAFGVVATMNPAGDFGKQELSPAMRSRLAEFYVPAIRDVAEVRTILQAHLEGGAEDGAGNGAEDGAEGAPGGRPAGALGACTLARGALIDVLLGFFARLEDIRRGEALGPTFNYSVRDVLAIAAYFREALAGARAGVLDDADVRCALLDACVLVVLDGLPTRAQTDNVALCGRVRAEAVEFLTDALGIRALRPGYRYGGARGEGLSVALEARGARQHLVFRRTAGSGSGSGAADPDPGLAGADTDTDTVVASIGEGPHFSNLRARSTMARFHFGAPGTARNAVRVAKALRCRRPVLLEGSPGAGKTSLVAALAAVCGHALVRINLSEQTELSDLLGCDLPDGAGGFAWADGVLLRAVRAGAWVLLDELNLASQTVLEGLNSLLDHRAALFIPDLLQTVACPPGFRLFGAQNPRGQGSGRKGLPFSFVNRFVSVYVDDLGAADYAFIVREAFPAVGDREVSLLLDAVAGVAGAVAAGAFGHVGGPWEVNLRDVLRILDFHTDPSLAAPLGGPSQEGLPAGGPLADPADPLRALRHLCELFICARFRLADDRVAAARLVDRCVPTLHSRAAPWLGLVETDTHVRIGRVAVRKCAPVFQDYAPLGGGSPVARGDARTDGVFLAHQAFVLQSILVAVQQSTCLILTGRSATGKSAMLRMLAAKLRQPLATFHMTSDTDPSDFLGGYEQADVARRLREVVAELLFACRFCRARLGADSAGAGMEPGAATEMKTADLSARLAALAHRLHEHGTAFASAEDLDRRAVRRACLGVLGDVERLLGGAPGGALDRADLVVAQPEEGYAGQHPRVQRFSELVASLQSLSELSAGPSAGAFEWRDQVLVACMERGVWLELSGANFCQPAALDRINSLLERDGFLDLTEQGLQQVRRVSVSPNFRLFITYDPAYGDISRAMRNRSLEVSCDTVPACGALAAFPAYPDLLRLSGCAPMAALFHELVHAGRSELTLQHLCHWRDLYTSEASRTGPEAPEAPATALDRQALYETFLTMFRSPAHPEEALRSLFDRTVAAYEACSSLSGGAAYLQEHTSVEDLGPASMLTQCLQQERYLDFARDFAGSTPMHALSLLGLANALCAHGGAMTRPSACAFLTRTCAELCLSDFLVAFCPGDAERALLFALRRVSEQASDPSLVTHIREFASAISAHIPPHSSANLFYSIVSRHARAVNAEAGPSSAVSGCVHLFRRITGDMASLAAMRTHPLHMLVICSELDNLHASHSAMARAATRSEEYLFRLCVFSSLIEVTGAFSLDASAARVRSLMDTHLSLDALTRDLPLARVSSLRRARGYLRSSLLSTAAPEREALWHGCRTRTLLSAYTLAGSPVSRDAFLSVWSLLHLDFEFRGFLSVASPSSVDEDVGRFVPRSDCSVLSDALSTIVYLGCRGWHVDSQTSEPDCDKKIGVVRTSIDAVLAAGRSHSPATRTYERNMYELQCLRGDSVLSRAFRSLCAWNIRHAASVSMAAYVLQAMSLATIKRGRRGLLPHVDVASHIAVPIVSAVAGITAANGAVSGGEAECALRFHDEALKLLKHAPKEYLGCARRLLGLSTQTLLSVVEAASGAATDDTAERILAAESLYALVDELRRMLTASTDGAVLSGPLPVWEQLSSAADLPLGDQLPDMLVKAGVVSVVSGIVLFRAFDVQEQRDPVRRASYRSEAFAIEGRYYAALQAMMQKRDLVVYGSEAPYEHTALMDMLRAHSAAATEALRAENAVVLPRPSLREDGDDLFFEDLCSHLGNGEGLQTSALEVTCSLLESLGARTSIPSPLFARCSHVQDNISALLSQLTNFVAQPLSVYYMDIILPLLCSLFALRNGVSFLLYCASTQPAHASSHDVNTCLRTVQSAATGASDDFIMATLVHRTLAECGLPPAQAASISLGLLLSSARRYVECGADEPLKSLLSAERVASVAGQFEQEEAQAFRRAVEASSFFRTRNQSTTDGATSDAEDLDLQCNQLFPTHTAFFLREPPGVFEEQAAAQPSDSPAQSEPGGFLGRFDAVQTIGYILLYMYGGGDRPSPFIGQMLPCPVTRASILAVLDLHTNGLDTHEALLSVVNLLLQREPSVGCIDESFYLSSVCALAESGKRLTFPPENVDAAARAPGKVRRTVECRDIYRHPYPSEAVCFCTGLLRDVTARTTELLEEFPGFPGLEDITFVCRRLSELPVLSTPLIRLLAGAELLAQKLTDWDASSPTTHHYGPIAAGARRIVVRWRRLELMGWNTLFVRAEDESVCLALTYWPELLIAGLTLARAANLGAPGAAEALHAQVRAFALGSTLGQLSTRRRILLAVGALIEQLCTSSATLSAEYSNGDAAGSVFTAVYHETERLGAFAAREIADRTALIRKGFDDQVRLFEWDEKSFHTVRADTHRSHRIVTRIMRAYNECLQLPVRVIAERLAGLDARASPEHMRPLQLAGAGSGSGAAPEAAGYAYVRAGLEAVYGRAVDLCRRSDKAKRNEKTLALQGILADADALLSLDSLGRGAAGVADIAGVDASLPDVVLLPLLGRCGAEAQFCAAQMVADVRAVRDALARRTLEVQAAEADKASAVASKLLAVVRHAAGAIHALCSLRDVFAAAAAGGGDAGEPSASLFVIAAGEEALSRTSSLPGTLSSLLVRLQRVYARTADAAAKLGLDSVVQGLATGPRADRHTVRVMFETCFQTVEALRLHMKALAGVSAGHSWLAFPGHALPAARGVLTAAIDLSSWYGGVLSNEALQSLGPVFEPLRSAIRELGPQFEEAREWLSVLECACGAACTVEEPSAVLDLPDDTPLFGGAAGLDAHLAHLRAAPLDTQLAWFREVLNCLRPVGDGLGYAVLAAAAAASACSLQGVVAWRVALPLPAASLRSAQGALQRCADHLGATLSAVAAYAHPLLRMLAAVLLTGYHVAADQEDDADGGGQDEDEARLEGGTGLGDGQGARDATDKARDMCEDDLLGNRAQNDDGAGDPAGEESQGDNKGIDMDQDFGGRSESVHTEPEDSSAGEGEEQEQDDPLEREMGDEQGESVDERECHCDDDSVPELSAEERPDGRKPRDAGEAAPNDGADAGEGADEDASEDASESDDADECGKSIASQEQSGDAPEMDPGLFPDALDTQEPSASDLDMSDGPQSRCSDDADGGQSLPEEGSADAEDSAAPPSAADDSTLSDAQSRDAEKLDSPPSRSDSLCSDDGDSVQGDASEAALSASTAIEDDGAPLDSAPSAQSDGADHHADVRTGRQQRSRDVQQDDDWDRDKDSDSFAEGGGASTADPELRDGNPDQMASDFRRKWMEKVDILRSKDDAEEPSAAADDPARGEDRRPEDTDADARKFEFDHKRNTDNGALGLSSEQFGSNMRMKDWLDSQPGAHEEPPAAEGPDQQEDSGDTSDGGELAREPADEAPEGSASDGTDADASTNASESLTCTAQAAFEAPLPEERRKELASLARQFTESRPGAGPSPDPSGGHLAMLQRGRALLREYYPATSAQAFALAETLRMILEPTLTSALKGDFRTGKRLNMRKIIPYIASDFRKDKIWLRRTKPNKRTYQVLIALDDSQSMRPRAAGAARDNGYYALQALVLLFNAMKYLEVGQLGVIRFGDRAERLVDLSDTFSEQALAQALGTFSFEQKETDFPLLLQCASDYLEGAKSLSSSEAAQLILIVSDGRLRDRAGVAQLVRMCVTRRQMPILVLLDTEPKSVMDIKSISFVKDAAGKTAPVSTAYLDAFPFDNFAVLRRVEDLPRVLASLLRQWMEALQMR